jgi:hypothetical protein
MVSEVCRLLGSYQSSALIKTALEAAQFEGTDDRIRQQIWKKYDIFMTFASEDCRESLEQSSQVDVK